MLLPKVVDAAVSVATAAVDAIRPNRSATVGLVGVCGFSTALGGFIQSLLIDRCP